MYLVLPGNKSCLKKHTYKPMDWDYTEFRYHSSLNFGMECGNKATLLLWNTVYGISAIMVCKSLTYQPNVLAVRNTIFSKKIIQ